MKRLILFRCHLSDRFDPVDHLVLCKQRLDLLKELNPGAQIHILYGGLESGRALFGKYLGSLVDGFFVLTCGQQAQRYHFDSVLTEWFIRVGQHCSFDVLHVVEWDLLYTRPLAELYSHIPPDTLGLSGFGTTTIEAETDWSWVVDPAWRPRLLAFLGMIKQRYGLDEGGVLRCCFGPGHVFPRRFVEWLVEQQPVEQTVDEIQIPTYAEAGGFRACDNGIVRQWEFPLHKRYFNCDMLEIEPCAMAEQLLLADGRRVFHPVTRLLPKQMLEVLLRATAE